MNPEIQERFDSFPQKARNQLIEIRQLIFEAAEENNLGCVEETLKWGEPSYLVKGGSAIRIDWKSKAPDVVKVFFHCQTTLVETFKEIYRSDFKYEGQRAIVIPISAKIKKRPLRHCIELALRYHTVKHLPLLGA